MGPAVEATFVKTGQALTVTALTTAAAFFLLTIAGFRGFSEFGFIAGTGILFALVAMTVLLPAVLGIGDDAGIHLVHRYREEGPGSILHVLRSTGEHITMSALTTMVGFAGLLLSFHPGLRSIGVLAVMAIGMTLLAALAFLPALLQELEDRKQHRPVTTCL